MERFDFTYNGLVQNEYGWWKVTAGKVDFNYNGLQPMNMEPGMYAAEK